MARIALKPGKAREVRQRLAEYVARFHDGDWERFGRAAGIDRTTVHGWKAGKRHTVPDVAKLVYLAERLRISLDWLLLGHGEPVHDPTAPQEPIRERFRIALIQHLSTSASEVEIHAGDDDVLVHQEQPRAEHFHHVLPDANTVFALAVELIRPLLSPALHRLIDRKRLRGVVMQELAKANKVGPDNPIHGGFSPRQYEEHLEKLAEAALEQHRAALVGLASRAEELNRKGLPPYQLISYDGGVPSLSGESFRRHHN